MRASVAGIAVAAAALISGCGATKTVSQAIDPVARAAEVTGNVQGYKMSANMTISTPAGAVNAVLSGVMDRAKRMGQMTATESVAGHSFTMKEVFSGLTFYMDASRLPGAAALTHGKRWLKMDMSSAFGSLGVGSLSTTSTDPSQFVDYLRAVSDQTKKVGTGTVRGVATTHYHAIVDLRKYPRLVAGPQRATVKRGLGTLEQALGGHTMAMDVWIDAKKLVRRVSFTMPECVNNQRLSMSMTMDLYGYGPQPATQLPPDSQAYDLSPLIAASMKNIKFGCTSSS